MNITDGYLYLFQVYDGPAGYGRRWVRPDALHRGHGPRRARIRGTCVQPQGDGASPGNAAGA